MHIDENGWLHEPASHDVVLPAPKAEGDDEGIANYWVQEDSEALWVVTICDNCGYLGWKKIRDVQT